MATMKDRKSLSVDDFLTINETKITSTNNDTHNIKLPYNDGTLALTNEVVLKDEGHAAYNCQGSWQTYSTTYKYVRITLPTTDIWRMVHLCIDIKQQYAPPKSGILFIDVQHDSSGGAWNTFESTVTGTLDTRIKVYASDRKYIYIEGLQRYSNLSIIKMLLNDTAASHSLPVENIDAVNSLPATFQSSTMHYSLNLGHWEITDDNTEHDLIFHYKG